MKILYFYWGENTSDDIVNSFLNFGHTCIKVTYPLANIDFDEKFIEFISKTAISIDADIIFTFNYFPVLSIAAQILNKNYVSWVYDCPHYSLFSNTVFNKNNLIFTFDKNQYLQLKEMNVENVFHLPLAVNVDRLSKMLINKSMYKYQISFIGSLYENNHFNNIVFLPDYIRGYIDSMLNLSKKSFCYDFISGGLTNDILDTLDKYINFNISPDYNMSRYYLYLTMLETKLTQLHRFDIIDILSKKYSVDIFTASDTSNLTNVTKHDYISYTSEQPHIFNESKINLNITSRTITSGIPLRALDIMGSNGFMLSNYQPELLEYFEDGKDLALFSDLEEMCDKANYYLSHDSQRETISQNGFNKIKDLFSYEHQIKEILKRI